MSEATTQVNPETSTTTPATTAPETHTPATTTSQGLSTPAPSALEFIPEAYRNEGWATKYKTPDELFKGISHMSKMMGQKQVVEGIQIPGEGATDEDYAKFYQSIGRPESPDKYSFSEVQAHEGFDIESEKQGFAESVHKLGLTQKQADELFKIHISRTNEKFQASQAQVKETFDKALVTAFGNEFQKGLDSAKKGAKALGIADKLDSEGLSANPLVLQVLAKLGEYTGEDSLIDGGSGESKESLLEEAVRLQKSQLYQSGDPATMRKVEEIYKKVYPGKKTR